MQLLPPQGGGVQLSVSSVGSAQGTRWEGGGTSCHWRNPANTTLARCLRLTSVMISGVDGMFSRYDVLTMTLYLCGLPQNS